MPVTPLKNLTQIRQFNRDAWPGEESVEFVYGGVSEHAQLLPGIDVLISQRFTKEMGAAADSLKLLQLQGSGYENIDFSAVPKGCTVANVYEHEKPIAEWVIMAMIALNRQIIKTDRTFRTGSWEMAFFARAPLSPKLEGQTLGILGRGRIGKRIAHLARAFDMRIVTATRTLPSEEDMRTLGLEYVVTMSELERVLHESDFLVLSLPLSEETRGVIDKRALSLMKPSAFLITDPCINK